MRTRRSSLTAVVALAGSIGLLTTGVTVERPAALTAPSLGAEPAAWDLGSICAAASTAAYADAVAATPGLVSYWRLDERSGDFACDSRSFNAGAYGGGVRLGAAGKAGSAIELDGQSGSVKVVSSPSLQPTGAYAIEAWVRPASVTPSQTLVRKSGQYLVRITAGAIVFRDYRASGGYHELVSPPVLVADTWQHLVATDDGTMMRLFRDGQEVAAGPVRGAPARTEQPLLIGASPSYDYFGGRLDEVAVYDRALSPDQVAAHYGAADASPPLPPARLFAEPDDGEVTLHWSAPAPAGDAVSYRIYRQSPDGSWPRAALDTATGTTATDHGLTNGTAYTYRVTAVDAADNESAPSATASATPVAPGTVLWRGDMEEGTLEDWYDADRGGGVYNSGGGDAIASPERVHGGTWAARVELPDGTGGARLFRWDEAHRHRTLTYSAWLFIPRAYALGGESSGRYWILDEFKSSTADRSRNDPFWYIAAFNRPDGSLGAQLSWGYQSRLEGPHDGEVGWRSYGDVTVPIGRWFQIAIRLRQSNRFDGAVAAWLDGQPLADLDDVRTGWPNCTYNSWCVDQGWAVTNYSDNLSPAPATIFVDDAAITR